MKADIKPIRSREVLIVGAPLALLIALVCCPAVSQAQFTANYRTNIISGVVSNWTGDYNVGNATFANVLLIQPNGVLSNGFGNLGNATGSSNNVAVVAGSGAVWRNTSGLRVGYFGSANNLVISNAGKVLVNGSTYVGASGSSSNNSILVAGTSSVWSNGDMFVGQYTTGNSLVVSNGGQVMAESVSVSDALSSGNNQILVTGPGSVWNTRTTFKLGTIGSGGNSLVVSNGGLLTASTLSAGYNSPNNTLTVAGGSVVAGSLQISAFSMAANSLVRVDGGSLFVTNAAGTAVLEVGKAATGSFILNGGNVTADRLLIDGSGSLNGCGTVTGSVLVTGQVTADCGGTLTFTGILTNNGTMRALNGSVLESYGPVVNNGTIDITFDTTNFHSTFINNGVVTTNNFPLMITSFRVVGPDARISFTTAVGKSYAVETNSGPVAGSWGTWTNNITGTGATVTLTNFGGASLPKRFYRIRTSD
jgi:T5SS/PEP-CTERM-associated repeat protein